MRSNQPPLSGIAVFLLVSITLFTACAHATAKNALPVPTLTATELASPPSATESSAVPPSVTPDPTTTAPPTSAPLSNPEIDYPLALGNTWVFQSTRYQGYPISEPVTAMLVITETVVDVENASPYFIAKIHQDRSAEAPFIVPDGRQSELRPAESGDYWLVLEENRLLYRQENKHDLSKLEEALVKFVFPLKVGDRWPLTENQTKMLPSGVKPGMTRQVVKRGTVVVPAGRFADCALLREEWVDAAFEDWFCPNVGIVESKSDHRGVPESWHRVLIHYELK